MLLLNLYILVVSLFKKLWLWLIIIIVLLNFWIVFFSIFFECIFKWLVGLLRIRKLIGFKSNFIIVRCVCLFFESIFIFLFDVFLLNIKVFRILCIFRWIFFIVIWLIVLKIVRFLFNICVWFWVKYLICILCFSVSLFL